MSFVVKIFVAVLVLGGIFFLLEKNSASVTPIIAPTISPTPTISSTPSPVSTPRANPTPAPSISITPAKIIQGEPILVQIKSADLPEIKNISFDGKFLGVFSYKSEPSALIGIDLNQKPGTYKLLATLTTGEKLEKNITIGIRPKVEAPLGIPEKLGGNTEEAVTNVISTMAQESQTLLGIKTASTALWTVPFRFPLAGKITVTDDYGYVRQTVGEAINHKGTDFHADEGTPVLAMNTGIVRIARLYQIYGNTVVIDHGLGLMSIYMHLSKINVKVGEKVNIGQTIALSGQTGYAESPHLHITVRINDISIDPMKFMAFFAK
ncbi:MAG: peptidoglycan DD-metalloendopeptidase family protein [Candidatus Pacebacteria bacterium]|nr:peptidoglycan DD-metalloendopeptidase family protein [Candidatus Paceibacterota bacterium]MDD5356738.1 peptidoglycan DD-metalloendopeptidase family protein [Candidatus Paceibacterota bacterium]